MYNQNFTHKKYRSKYILFVLIVVISLIMSGCGAKKAKTYKVGILSGLNFLVDTTDGFKAKMTELGYEEGKNIVYDVQATDFDMEVYRSILKKFVDDKVDLIVTFPTEASLEGKTAIQGTDIPMVFTYCLIEGMGIVDSVREPGGNITGVRYPGPDIALKRFEVMLQLAPDAKRILVPYQKGYPIVAAQLEALKVAAATAGVELVEAPAVDAADLQAQLDGMVTGDDPGVDAILMIVEPLAVTPDPFVVMAKFAEKYQLPFGGASMGMDVYASVYGINVSGYKSGELAAPLADKILKGAKAGTIPVVSSDSFLAINLKAAQQFGVTVPDDLLSQAVEIVR
jgi:putative ABC transport system substrate-binding protein